MCDIAAFANGKTADEKNTRRYFFHTSPKPPLRYCSGGYSLPYAFIIVHELKKKNRVILTFFYLLKVQVSGVCEVPVRVRAVATNRTASVVLFFASVLVIEYLCLLFLMVLQEDFYVYI